MAEERRERPDRVDRVVKDLLGGKKVRVGPADAPERPEILMAARLAAAREGRPHMSAAFRKKLASQLQAEPPRSFPSRRAALVAGIGLAVGAVAGVGMAEVGGRRQAPVRLARTNPSANPSPTHTPQGTEVIDPRPGRWVDVVALAELVEGEARLFDLGAFSAFLVRRGDKVIGLSSVCSHLPCTLHYSASPPQLVCPCHNQSFDMWGQPNHTDYPVAPLAAVRVQIIDGRVQVRGV